MIQLLSAVRVSDPDDPRPRNLAWPPKVRHTRAARVSPGESVCVKLLTLLSQEDYVELPWGRLDPITGALDYYVHSEGMSFARPCLLYAKQITMECDAGEYAEAPNKSSVTFAARPPRNCTLAGMWLSRTPHVYEPVAFKLLMAPAGTDLAPYCTRQPVLIPTAQFANWLNPTVSTKELQGAPVAGAFEILDLAPTEQPAAA